MSLVALLHKITGTSSTLEIGLSSVSFELLLNMALKPARLCRKSFRFASSFVSHRNVFVFLGLIFICHLNASAENSIVAVNISQKQLTRLHEICAKEPHLWLAFGPELYLPCPDLSLYVQLKLMKHHREAAMVLRNATQLQLTIAKHAGASK